METHPKDLRYFLQILDERWPGEVLRVDTAGKEFDLAECDAAAAARFLPIPLPPWL